MKKILFPFIALTVLISATNSCNSSAENVETTESEVDAANKELQLSKEALTKDIATYKSDMNNQIYENKTTIANLKSDLNQQNMPYEEGREAKISELELRNSEMEIKINNYNDENKDNWDKFKTEFDQDMNSMKNSFQGLNVTN